jgi:phosphate starvation-inducible PhoH-like protein
MALNTKLQTYNWQKWYASVPSLFSPLWNPYMYQTQKYMHTHTPTHLIMPTSYTPTNWKVPLKHHYVAKTLNQQIYVDYLKDSNVNMVVGYGTTGTGKSLFATQIALEDLIAGTVEKIVFINSIHDTLPTVQSLMRFYSSIFIHTLLRYGYIEIIPISSIVGRTFHNSWVVACNIHNVSPDNMKTLVTRVGKNTKIVLTGDVKTTCSTTQHGFMDFVNRLFRHKPHGVELVEMQYEDILRSTFLSRILEIYEPVDQENIQIIEKNIVELERNSELEVAAKQSYCENCGMNCESLFDCELFKDVVILGSSHID